MSNAITTEARAGALIVRFTRPEVRNPLSTDVLVELGRILENVGSARMVIFTGSDGVFASGADLREIAALTADDAAVFARRGQSLMARIERSGTPAVAAIDGPCFGGGLDLALSCSRRIASPRSKFCHPGAGLGIITGWGGTQRLPRLVGEGLALEMLFAASVVDANEALRIGLVDQLAEDPLAAALSS
jgi:enoyl-CoA hydratase